MHEADPGVDQVPSRIAYLRPLRSYSYLDVFEIVFAKGSVWLAQAPHPYAGKTALYLILYCVLTDLHHEKLLN